MSEHRAGRSLCFSMEVLVETDTQMKLLFEKILSYTGFIKVF